MSNDLVQRFKGIFDDLKADEEREKRWVLLWQAFCDLWTKIPQWKSALWWKQFVAFWETLGKELTKTIKIQTDNQALRQLEEWVKNNVENRFRDSAVEVWKRIVITEQKPHLKVTNTLNLAQARGIAERDLNKCNPGIEYRFIFKSELYDYLNCDWFLPQNSILEQYIQFCGHTHTLVWKYDDYKRDDEYDDD